MDMRPILSSLENIGALGDSKKRKERIMGKWIGLTLGILGALLGITVAVIAAVNPQFLASMFGLSAKALGIQPKVEGTFSADGGTLGTWTFQPDLCVSGERQGYFGVLLTKKGDSTHFVKVAQDPTTGKAVLTVRIPGTDKTQILRSCKLLTSSVTRTNTRVNRIWSVQGTVQVDCPTAHFKGKATFANCH